jgi:hypothetical protein
VGKLPDPKLPGNGMPRLKHTKQITVYNTTLSSGGNNTDGLYNHGPMVVFFEGMFLCSWYNSPLRESVNMRVLLASSPDAREWSTPQEIFPAVNAKGEENEPFPIINGRLYGLAADVNFGNKHDSGIQGWVLMRRIISPTVFGPIFWLASGPPPSAMNVSVVYPVWAAMDTTTKQDAAQYLDSLGEWAPSVASVDNVVDPYIA